ncbi:TolC family protein [Corallococcus sp. M34]|uniref:TolC family protein n=1 Tax=Citreicoccus inhibens TaxID=2849499 RepID=UPI001C23AEB9|nr:TolC family protein [Citreicoccus inhibens]MBU8899905.1 TolC family protein [Citreicoccus inhibens]
MSRFRFTVARKPWLPFVVGLLSMPALAQRALTAENAVALALDHSPRLIPARAEVEEARARVQGAGLLFQQNPELTVAAGPRLRPEGDSADVSVGLSQRIELPGQRSARRDAAGARLDASEARWEALRVDLAAEAREAHALALAAQEETRLAEEGRALAEEALRAARERHAAGAASSIEVNTARVEQGRAAREHALAVQRRDVALAQLRLLMGLEPSETLDLVNTPTKPEEVPPLAALVDTALARRPEVRAARSGLAAARAEATLARREALPSPRLGASYGREEGATIIQGTLAIDLPLFQRNQEARGASAARATAADSTVRAVEQQVRSEVTLARQRYESAVTATSNYSDEVLAAVQQNLELINEAYRAGKVDFLELLIIRRESLDTRRGAIEARREMTVADARLKQSLGSIP